MTSIETQIKELTKLIKNQEDSAINDQKSFQFLADIKGRRGDLIVLDFVNTAEGMKTITRCSKK